MNSDARISFTHLRQMGRRLLGEQWGPPMLVDKLEEVIFHRMLQEYHRVVTPGADTLIPTPAEAYYRHLLAVLLDRLRPEHPLYQEGWAAAVAAGEATLEDFFETDPFQRAPRRWEKIQQEEERNREVLEHAKDFLATSSAYKCKNRRCKSTRFRTDRVQIRSADEAMTTIIRCVECGTGWTEN